jgi:hypothetical protein
MIKNNSDDLELQIVAALTILSVGSRIEYVKKAIGDDVFSFFAVATHPNG